MSLVNSPKIKYDPRGAHERRPLRLVLVRSATIVLIVTAIGLALVIWVGGDVMNRALGHTGVVQGIVLDEAGQPLANSEIFLLRAPETVAYTDAAGRFELPRVPTGKHSLIVAVGAWGQEYPVVIQPRAHTDMGTLTYLTPPLED